MRDLTSRLRSIIRQDHGGRARPAAGELTYVPDLPEPARSPDTSAKALGGRLDDAGGGCIIVDRRWEADEWYGRRQVGSYAIEPSAPLQVFDPRAGSTPAWARRIVFFDLETTGLSGGAGTLAFLAGCGWFEDGAFTVRQFFLAGPSAERGMLDAIARVFADASLLVTFNGRTFDVPLMETRWAFHRTAAPTDDLSHFDMLPPARRLWGRRELRAVRSDFMATQRGGWGSGEAPAPSSCSLSSLERSILGVTRVGDVPGFEIPARYFHYLRSGDTSAIEGVLAHNRHDLLSLAGVMAHALRMAEEGPSACRDAPERLALGRMYERAGDETRAEDAFRSAATGGDSEVREHALARLATLLRRQERHQESADAWQGVIDGPGARRTLSPLQRRAAEALAIHHEHRAHDLASARRYAEQLKADVDGRLRQEAEHRLGRIDRKLKSTGTSKDGRLKWDQ